MPPSLDPKGMRAVVGFGIPARETLADPKFIAAPRLGVTAPRQPPTPAPRK